MLLAATRRRRRVSQAKLFLVPNRKFFLFGEKRFTGGESEDLF